MNLLQMDDSINERVSQEDENISTARKDLQGEGKELRNLEADMLGEVFSYLPQKELFELMSVSKHWGETVMEGSGLWRKVDVRRRSLGGVTWRDMRDNIILRRVIGFAEDVTFSKSFFSAAFTREEMHELLVGGWLAPNLRILELPSEYILPIFFPTPVSKCPLLESLVVVDTGALGSDPVHIRHPNLKSLSLSNNQPMVVSIDCPALTHLYTHCELRSTGVRDSDTPPSFFFPKLKIMTLLCTPRTQFLEAVAAHAPNITSLDAIVRDGFPFIALTRFKALQLLQISNYSRGVIPANAFNTFTSWPLLESLKLYLVAGAKDIEVAHVGLKSLEIDDHSGPTSPILSCISLENLKLFGETLEAKCLKNLDQSCPKLKRLDLGRLLKQCGPDEFGDADEADGPLEIVHEKVEELVLRDFSRSSIRVACTNLKKLVMMWGHPRWWTVSATLRLPTLECPKLKCLELSGYDHMFRSIPAMLSMLPELESLRCDCGREDLEDVVLEHQNLREIVVAMTQMKVRPMRVRPAGSEMKLKRLTLTMPGLVRVEVVESIRVVVEKEGEEVVVKYTIV